MSNQSILCLVVKRTVVKRQRVFHLIQRNFKTNRYLALQTLEQKNVSWENAKPVSEIPSPPKLPLIGHANLMLKNKNQMHVLHDELRQKYGNIVKFSMIGRDVIYIYGPEETRVLYANEGPNPVALGMKQMEFHRYTNTFIHYYMTTQGNENLQFISCLLSMDILN